MQLILANLINLVNLLSVVFVHACAKSVLGSGPLKGTQVLPRSGFPPISRTGSEKAQVSLGWPEKPGSWAWQLMIGRLTIPKCSSKVTEILSGIELAMVSISTLKSR